MLVRICIIRGLGCGLGAVSSSFYIVRNRRTWNITSYEDVITLSSEGLDMTAVSAQCTWTIPSGKSKKFLAGLFSLSALKSLFKADKENQARDLLKFDLRFK